MTNSAQTIHVAVGVICHPQGQVLLTRRPDHVHQGGVWEFPGGKVESGENVTEALDRELNEELGIRPGRYRPLIRVRYRYPECDVLLDVWRIDEYTGEPYGHEGQAMEWVSLSALTEWSMPAANRPIVQALQLPTQYLITPDPAQYEREDFLTHLHRSMTDNVRLVQLRAPMMDIADYIDLAQVAHKICSASNARLILNQSPDSLLLYQADGLHLNSQHLMQCRQRPLPEHLLLSASCHDATEVEQANRLGADLIVAGPVKPTTSHPDTQTIGWTHFQELSEMAQMPVYALGGLCIDDETDAFAHGAQGIAAISGLWQ